MNMRILFKLFIVIEDINLFLYFMFIYFYNFAISRD